MTEEEGRDLEHAWRHFALHAQQRMAVFNFYVASAGLALTGLAWTLANKSKLWPLGAAAGVAAAGLSLVFWRLDQRGAQLVKVGEDAMAAVEGTLSSASSTRVITRERMLPTNAGWWAPSAAWTFGRSFRLLFGTVAFVGFCGAVLTSAIGISNASRVEGKASGARPVACFVLLAKMRASPPTVPQNRATNLSTQAKPVRRGSE